MRAEFAQWWQANYFYRNDLYEIFERLYTAGANLDYIRWLCEKFLLLDEFSEISQRRLLKKAHKKNGPALAIHNKPDPRAILIFSGNLIEFTIDYLKQHGLVDSTQDTLQIIPSSARQKIISDVAIYTSRLDLLIPFYQRMIESLETHGEELTITQKEDDEDLFRRAPLFRLVNEYQSRHGTRSDTWGTFFILAITEHLREKTGHRTHHKLAQRLWKICQSSRRVKKRSSSKPPSLERNTANVKISILKNHHPEWSRHLAILEQAFRDSKKMTPIVSSGSWPPPSPFQNA
jgi:hypothetical protein